MQVDEADSKIETAMRVNGQIIIARLHTTMADSVIYLLSKLKNTSQHKLKYIWRWIMTCSYARLVPVQW